MALGLHGHLASLSEFHLYNYLQEKHELTVVGLLLSISAARLSVPPSPLLPSLPSPSLPFIFGSSLKLQDTNLSLFQFICLST